ncbi:MAG: tetratricopeptide repeat protein, partial [bacterium]|nr:tetratricopeptide repeat protein [bacterium]
GELSRRGELLRLELGVVDAATGRRLRGTVIEDSVSNVASFQEQPVVRIATLLDLPTTSDLQARLASMATTTPEGFQSYLRGIGLLTEPFDGGDLDRAINLLEKAVSIDPLFVAGRVALGRAYLEKFDVTSDLTWLEQADAEAVRAISDEDAAYEAFELLFQVRRRQDRLIDSLEALEHGVRANPQNVDALLKLADEYRNAERFEDSEAQIQNALLLRPGYWPAHDILARLYRTQGRYEAAAVQFREVVNTAPLLTRGYNNLGPVLWFLGRTDEARTLFEQSLAIEPSRSALSNLGTLNFDDRRFADAVDMFKRAIEVDDSRYLTWGNLGYAYRFGPAPERSDACFRKAVELATKRRESEPGNLWILTDIAAYHAMLDEYVQGLELLEQAIAGAPEEPQLIAHIAETFEDLGERDQALVWVARSFEAGVSPRQFDDRPTLRELVADDRYQQLVVDATHYP